MPRAQNAHALVNAGFLLKIEKNIIKRATLVYGCINAKFTHAKETEKLLIGKNLFDNATLQTAYCSLSNELNPKKNSLDPTPEFRKKLAISLFYKVVHCN